MAWDSIIGQERVKRLLRRAMSQKSVAHAYLFHGREGVGKDALAMEFAKTLQCRDGGDEACGTCPSCRKMEELAHPDIRMIVPLPVGKSEKAGDDPIQVLSEDVVEHIRSEWRAKGKDPYHEIEIPKGQFIKINSVRDLKRESSMSPVEGRYKIFLILGAEAMNAEAANSLLKTLEEPLPNAVLLLTTAYRERLTPTVLSRVQQVECSPLTEDEIAEALQSKEQVGEAEARGIAQVADGNYRRARSLVGSDLGNERGEVIQFLRLTVGRPLLPLTAELDRLAATYEKPRLEDWLLVLASWLRDAMLLQAGVDLPGHRREAAMDNFLRKFPHVRLPEALRAVEDAIADLRKNVYLPLVLTTLALSLRESVAPPTRPS